MTTRSHTTIPRNPVPGVIYGVTWLLIAVILGTLLLSFSSNPEALSEFRGQRTLGFTLFTPFIALAASIFCFVRAAATSGPYKQYLASTTPAQRQQNEASQWKNTDKIGGLIAFAVLVILGWLTLLIVFLVNYETITSNVQSLTSFVGVFLLIGLAAGSLLRLIARMRSARP